MAFLDEIGKKISQTSQGMVQKTKDTAESMRLSSAISDEEKRIDGLFFEIGKLYFELHANDYDPQLEELVLSVKEANTKIENYNEQIKRLKGIVRCPNCNGEVTYGSPFCSHCGTKMELPTEAEEDKKVRRCKNCGLPLPDGAGFCTNCGTAAPLDPEEAALRRCKSCGSVLPDGVAFCTNCGTKAEDTPAPAVAPAVKHCPNCGGTVPADMAFCSNCGTRVS